MPVSGLDREKGASGLPGQPPGTQRLTISLFGGVTLHYGGRRISLQSCKAEALLGYLALSAKQRESRERIVGLLWSETDESKARASLRQVLKNLRSVFDELGFEGFSTDHTEVSLEADAVDVDVGSIVASLATDRVSDALLERPRITESLLAGYDDIDPAFRSWLLVHREGLHQKLTRGLEDQLANAPSEGSQARRLADALIHLDATHEGAYQRLIRSYADAGDVSGALSAYKKLWELLGDEYDMEPSDKTQELIAAIKSGTYRATQPTLSERPGELRTAPHTDTTIPIAAPPAAFPDNPPLKLVLLMGPFDVTGMQPEQRHIGRGFRYELITRLIRFREWSLIDAAAGSPQPQDTLALRPHYTISANFLQDRDKLSVVVTLKAGDIGAVVWSDRYSLGLTDFFEAQQRHHEASSDRPQRAFVGRAPYKTGKSPGYFPRSLRSLAARSIIVALVEPSGSDSRHRAVRVRLPETLPILPRPTAAWCKWSTRVTPLFRVSLARPRAGQNPSLWQRLPFNSTPWIRGRNFALPGRMR